MAFGKSQFGHSAFGKTDTEKEQEERDKRSRGVAPPPPTMTVEEMKDSFADPTGIRGMNFSFEVAPPTFANDPTEPAPTGTVGTGTAGGTQSSGPLGQGQTSKGFPGDDDDPTADDNPPDADRNDALSGDEAARERNSEVANSPASPAAAAGLGLFGGAMQSASTKGQVGQVGGLVARGMSPETLGQAMSSTPANAQMNAEQVERGLRGQQVTDYGPVPGKPATQLAKDLFGDIFGDWGDSTSSPGDVSGAETSDGSEVDGGPEEGQGDASGNPDVMVSQLFGPNPSGPDDGFRGTDVGELVMKKTNASKFSPQARQKLASGDIPGSAIAKIEKALFG